MDLYKLDNRDRRVRKSFDELRAEMIAKREAKQSVVKKILDKPKKK